MDFEKKEEMTEQRDIFLQGVAISRGIAIGTPFLLNPVQKKQESLPDMQSLDIEKELQAYQKAREKSLSELQTIRKQLIEEGSLEASAIVEGQEQMLQDSIFAVKLGDEIRKESRSAELTIRLCLARFKEIFSSVPDSYIRERYRDIEEIGCRLLFHIHQSPWQSLSDVPAKSVVFAEDLSTSDTASAKASHVYGLVTKQGSAHSHAAIVAKAKGIPYVGCVKGDWTAIDQSRPVIIDGRSGMVILNPSLQTLNKYQLLQEQIASRKQVWQKTPPSSQTADGKSILCSANIESLPEAKQLVQYGADGVGLFRSEFLLMGRQELPSEEEQTRIYRSLIHEAKKRPLTIRTFDIREDKVFFPSISLSQSTHSYKHSTRFFEENKEGAKVQCRALWQAALAGPLQVLFPMISSVEEFCLAKALLQEAKEELHNEGVAIGEIAHIGAMIEIPSAALTADLIAKEADFLAIGTNDLLQYGMAKDRKKQTQPLDSDSFVALIRFLAIILEHGMQQQVPVKICGGVAADPHWAQLLIGMGIQELSIPLRSVPLIKYIIQHTDRKEAQNLAAALCKETDGKQILSALLQAYRSRFPEDFVCSFVHPD